MTRHAKDGALSDREFELLLEGARDLDPYFSIEAKFCILVGGRLGLRRGEIGHIREEWIDWRRRMIQIPQRAECGKGRDGGYCGDCRQKAKQEARVNGISVEEALEDRWRPKTEAANREVPFDFDPRVELAIERFFDTFDGWERSCQVVNRRIKRAAEHAPDLDAAEIWPHGLRSTAASYHAARGLDSLTLQALLGWADLSTARKYVKSSGENTARALHQTHSR